MRRSWLRGTVVGARNDEQVSSMLAGVSLSAAEAEHLGALVPRGAAAVTRYPAAALADLDS